MSKLLYLSLLFIFSVSLHAQQSEGSASILSYLQKAMNFNKVVPQEKVYLYLDNTGYFENETIWFKAYVTRTDSSRFTDLSKVLYVELLNQSVKTDAQGKAKVEFFNNSTCQEMYISVEGMTEDGKVLVNE